MKGQEHRRAVAAIDKTLDSAYARTETARAAITAVLGLLGARRIHAAVGFEPQAAGDRKVLTLLAAVEDAVVRLDATPVQEAHMGHRHEIWETICDGLTEARRFLIREEQTARVAARKRTG